MSIYFPKGWSITKMYDWMDKRGFSHNGIFAMGDYNFVYVTRI